MGKTTPFLVIFILFILFPCYMMGDESLLAPRKNGFSQRNVLSLAAYSEGDSHAATTWQPFHSFLPESREIIRGILPWNWENQLVPMTIGVLTIPLIITKNEIQVLIDLDRRDNTEDIPFTESKALYTDFEVLGDRKTLPILAGSMVLGGIILGSQREVETGLMLAQSLFFTAAVTGTGQFVLAEDRPHEGGEFNFFKMHGHGVSGHSSIAASMVRPLESQYLRIRDGDGGAMIAAKYLGKSLLYSAPVMVAVSRVRTNRHYLWNVILGFATGYAVGDVVADVHQKSDSGGDLNQTSWQVRPDLQGISFSFQW